jgi:hypothetical protein
MLQINALLLLRLQWGTVTSAAKHRAAINAPTSNAAVGSAAAGLLYDAARVCCQLSQEGLDAASQQALQTPGNRYISSKKHRS